MGQHLIPEHLLIRNCYLRVSVVLLASVLATQPALGNAEQELLKEAGLVQLLEGDYRGASDSCTRAARAESPAALYCLGLIANSGRLAPIDELAALDYFRRAADQGLLVAQAEMIAMSDDMPISDDLESAAVWSARLVAKFAELEQAAKRGDPFAQNNLAWMHLFGEGVERDPKKARVLLEKASAQGFSDSRALLAYIHKYGIGVPVDPDLAFSLEREAASEGAVWAARSLGQSHHLGEGTEANAAQAERWYKQAASRGHAQAKVDLAELYRSQSRFSDAERLLKDALATYKVSRRPASYDLTTTTQLLADLYIETARHEEAARVLTRLIKSIDGVETAVHYARVNAFVSLGGVRKVQGRFDDAESAYQRAVADTKRRVGNSHPHYAVVIQHLAHFYFGRGQTSASEKLFRDSLEILKRQPEGSELAHADACSGLEGVLVATGRHAEREELLRCALRVNESELGIDHLVSIALGVRLANYFRDTGRTREAEPRYERALKSLEASGTEGASLLWETLLGRAGLYSKMGRYDDAERDLDRAVKLVNASFDDDAARLGKIYTKLGNIQNSRQRPAAALELFQQAEQLLVESLGRNHLETLEPLFGVLSSSAMLPSPDQALFDQYAERILALVDASLESESTIRVDVIYALAVSFTIQDRKREAEELFVRVIGHYETVYGPSHEKVAGALTSLAQNLYGQGRYEEYKAVAVRAIKIYEAALRAKPDPRHAQPITILLGLLYDYEGADSLLGRLRRMLSEVSADKAAIARVILQQADSAPHGSSERSNLLREALRLLTEQFGEDSPELIKVLSELAENVTSEASKRVKPLNDASIEQMRTLSPGWERRHALIMEEVDSIYREANRVAEPLYQRIISIAKAAFGTSHPKYADALGELTWFYQFNHESVWMTDGPPPPFQKLRELRSEQLRVYEGLGGDVVSQSVAHVLSMMGYDAQREGDYETALKLVRRRNEILRKQQDVSANGSSSPLFAKLGLAGLGAQESPGRDTQRVAMMRIDVLRHVELAMRDLNESNRAARHAEAFEVSQLGGSSREAAAIRRVVARFMTSKSEVSKLVRDYQDAVDRAGDLKASLVEAISRSNAETAGSANQSELRSKLRATNERMALLSRRMDEKYPRYKELTQRQALSVADVQALIASDEALLTWISDWSNSWVFLVRKHEYTAYRSELGSSDLKKLISVLRSGVNIEGVSEPEQLPLFDIAASHEIYSSLFAPAEPKLRGVKNLYVVPEATAAGLPLAVLAVKPADGGGPYSAYRETTWMYQKYSLTVLPSVGSLRLLGEHSGDSIQREPFIGFGAPNLDAKESVLASGIPGSGSSSVNFDQLRGFEPLPETAYELRELARNLGADTASVHLGRDATETAVKRARLDRIKVVAFATHGLISGEVDGLDEPALLLTLPVIPTQHDDGLLTASEITQLRLNADLVVLSACNTGAPDGESGRGLSALVRSFFYAGARSLLVSQWLVDSRATAALTGAMFSELRANPQLGRAEALSRAMEAVAGDQQNKHYAHPAFWGAFMLMGAGS